jgi:hypothetical protein
MNVLLDLGALAALAVLLYLGAGRLLRRQPRITVTVTQLALTPAIRRADEELGCYGHTMAWELVTCEVDPPGLACAGTCGRCRGSAVVVFGGDGAADVEYGVALAGDGVLLPCAGGR